MENVLHKWESILTTQNISFTNEDSVLQAKTKLYVPISAYELKEMNIELIMQDGQGVNQCLSMLRLV